MVNTPTFDKLSLEAKQELNELLRIMGEKDAEIFRLQKELADFQTSN